MNVLEPEIPPNGQSWSVNMPTSYRELLHVSRLKYGPARRSGWAIRLRRRFGYFGPDVHYEAVLDRLVTPGIAWLDVGAGRHILPQNRALATTLAARCGLLCGVDPDESIEENELLHTRERKPIESFRPAQSFDLVTLRMVVEHLEDPQAAVKKLASLTRIGGKVAVYTVNRWSPTAIAACLTPMWVHHAAKRFLWGSDEDDTFPVAYKLNTRRELLKHFCVNRFQLVEFHHLADCCAFWRFRMPHFVELAMWRMLKYLHIRYPETCLLAVFERKT